MSDDPLRDLADSDGTLPLRTPDDADVRTALGRLHQRRNRRRGAVAAVLTALVVLPIGVSVSLQSRTGGGVVYVDPAAPPPAPRSCAPGSDGNRCPRPSVSECPTPSADAAREAPVRPRTPSSRASVCPTASATPSVSPSRTTTAGRVPSRTPSLSVSTSVTASPSSSATATPTVTPTASGTFTSTPAPPTPARSLSPRAG